MKRYINYLLILSFPFMSCTAYAQQQRLESAPVVNPVIPSKVEFAGKAVKLDRPDLWERYDRELTSMVYTHGNTLLTIKRANRYFPVIMPILKANGVPTDLAYLACIESYLNPRAYSPAKAAGFWQFIPSAGKEYGLEINDYVDERYNLEKATAAAARYLKSSYNRFGNWESAAASYNTGVARVSRELEAQQASSALDLYLVEETSRYMFRLLAMKEIMEHPAKYGFNLTADQALPAARIQDGDCGLSCGRLAYMGTGTGYKLPDSARQQSLDTRQIASKQNGQSLQGADSHQSIPAENHRPVQT